MRYRNKEISWLAFNARVLQEAADRRTPLIERIKFLGIFSSNLDEFFRIRVATLNRLTLLGGKAKKLIGHDPQAVLGQIQESVLALQADFDTAYLDILEELAREHIYIINEHQLNDAQTGFVHNYFREKVRPYLTPIMLDQIETFPRLKDHSIYLAVCLQNSADPDKVKYALIEVPADQVSRFLLLPQTDHKKYIILLDDIIRHSLSDIFSMFNFDQFKAYTIKVTRDAELEFDGDLAESFFRKVAKSLKQRQQGEPVRFVFDHRIPGDLLKFLGKQLNQDKTQSAYVPGSRYHNFKDFIGFPKVGPEHLRYPKVPAVPHKDFENTRSLLKVVQDRDVLLHYPYHSFDYVIDMLREAAIDPKVVSIKITLYRVAKQSRVINALINAAANGKKVTVAMELQARFDEEHNIYWSARLQEEGVRVIHGDPKYKVHCKLMLITRRHKGKKLRYAKIGTGNFNEATASIYTDHSFFTANSAITKEVEKVFDLLDNNYKNTVFRHLMVSPINMRQRITKLINVEIKNARNGKKAAITIKLNNLTDEKMINKLYEASNAGVKVRLMIRGMFSLITGVKGLSENIEAKGIIDKYLEHSRIYVFENDGEPKYFITSADWMPRNLDRRVEVSSPIYDKKLQKEINTYLKIQWADNVKSRWLNKDLDNTYAVTDDGRRIRCQEALFQFFHNKNNANNGTDGQTARESLEERSTKEDGSNDVVSVKVST